jgi:hypothetical protein
MTKEKSLSSCVRRVEPTVVYTPLPSSTAKEKDQDRDKKAQGDPFRRAENEDDDGYDPYSDRIETTPLFEKDPWS